MFLQNSLIKPAKQLFSSIENILQYNIYKSSGQKKEKKTLKEIKILNRYDL